MTIQSFRQATTAPPSEDGSVSLVGTTDWTQGRTLFGGVTAGAAIQSLQHVVDTQERPLRSMCASFVAPVRPEPFVITTEILRKGRGITQAEARLVQEGQTCAVFLCSFGATHERSLEVTPPAMPQVPPPEELQVFPYMEGLTPNFTQHIDYRWSTDSFPFSGSDRAQCQGWMRYKGDEPCTLPAFVSLCDAWPPPIFSHSSVPIAGSSVTWMLNLFREWPAEGDPADTWWFYDAMSTATHGGYADSAGSIWDRSGKLVARTRQLVVEFSK
jgi:acyl-CoA thioesterase